MSWLTFGHTHIKGIFDSQIENDRLSHAYLLTGPAGIGKSQLAREFAEKIIGQPNSVDISYYDLAEQGSVEDVRHLLKLSALTPVSGQRKVIIIDHINAASSAAGSSLLKTLEEPVGHTHFVLLSDSARVLPTIMSRCQVLSMSRLSPYEIQEYVASKNLSVSEEVIAASGGSTARLELFASGSQEAQLILSALKELKTALAAGSAQRVLQVQKLAELDDALLQTVLESWVHEQLLDLSKQPNRFSAIQAALETLQRLSTNANKKMALEYFLLNPNV